MHTSFGGGWMRIATEATVFAEHVMDAPPPYNLDQSPPLLVLYSPLLSLRSPLLSSPSSGPFIQSSPHTPLYRSSTCPSPRAAPRSAPPPVHPQTPPRPSWKQSTARYTIYKSMILKNSKPRRWRTENETSSQSPRLFPYDSSSPLPDNRLLGLPEELRQPIPAYKTPTSREAAIPGAR